jgi:hypothetical protein
MPGSTTTPDRPRACDGARGRTAFRYTDSVGTQNKFSFAAPWLEHAGGAERRRATDRAFLSCCEQTMTL